MDMVETTRVRLMWLLVFLFLTRGGVLIYLLYCLLNPKRICCRCNRRIPRTKGGRA
jgi:hypothetical protein